MKLAECLSVADTSLLRKIADHYGFACSRHSKMALIQEIMVRFRDPSFLTEHMPHWGKSAQHAILRLSMDPRKRFSAEDITALFRCNQDEGPIREALAEGWLFAVTQQNGRFAYLIPDEVGQCLRDYVVDQFAEGIQTDFDGPLVYRDESHAMSRDLDVLLEYIAHHEVRLTTEGSMYKRNLQQVLELLEVSEEIPTDAWRFGYGRRFHEYPDRLALLYDFAFHKQFLEEGSDGWLRIHDKASEWATTAPLDRQRQILRFYLSLYRRPIVRLPLIVQLLVAVSPDWVQSSSMLEVLDHLVSDYYYDDRSQVWNVRIMKMLTHLGMIRTGADADGEMWFQITKLGQQLITPDSVTEAEPDRKIADRILIVQPNFDIVVTADQPVVTTELAKFTDLWQSGMVRVYRLSENSMKRGLSAGRSGEDWLRFLSQHAQTAVPGNVERMIAQWSKAYAVEPLADAE